MSNSKQSSYSHYRFSLITLSLYLSSSPSFYIMLNMLETIYGFFFCCIHLTSNWILIMWEWMNDKKNTRSFVSNDTRSLTMTNALEKFCAHWEPQLEIQINLHQIHINWSWKRNNLAQYVITTKLMKFSVINQTSRHKALDRN